MMSPNRLASPCLHEPFQTSPDHPLLMAAPAGNPGRHQAQEARRAEAPVPAHPSPGGDGLESDAAAIVHRGRVGDLREPSRPLAVGHLDHQLGSSAKASHLDQDARTHSDGALGDLHGTSHLGLYNDSFRSWATKSNTSPRGRSMTISPRIRGIARALRSTAPHPAKAGDGVCPNRWWRRGGCSRPDLLAGPVAGRPTAPSPATGSVTTSNWTSDPVWNWTSGKVAWVRRALGESAAASEAMPEPGSTVAVWTPARVRRADPPVRLAQRPALMS